MFLGETEGGRNGDGRKGGGANALWYVHAKKNARGRGSDSGFGADLSDQVRIRCAGGLTWSPRRQPLLVLVSASPPSMPMFHGLVLSSLRANLRSFRGGVSVTGNVRPVTGSYVAHPVPYGTLDATSSL